MLHFVTALLIEARPLIERFRMKPQESRGRISIFQGDEARLVISGVGCLRSAIATTSLGERFAEPRAIWMNVGLCGHQNAPIGQAFLANRISWVSSRDTYYPQCPWDSPWSGIGLLSLDQPSTDYAANAYDMEAYGFYSAALQFTTTEWIHCLKIVSDNARNPVPERLSEETVSSLIFAQVPFIEKFRDSIMDAGPKNPPSDWSKQLARDARQRIRFSKTQTLQLEDRLAKLDLLLSETEKLQIDDILKNPHPHNLLERLQSLVDQHSANQIC